MSVSNAPAKRTITSSFVLYTKVILTNDGSEQPKLMTQAATDYHLPIHKETQLNEAQIHLKADLRSTLARLSEARQRTWSLVCIIGQNYIHDVLLMNEIMPSAMGVDTE